MDLEGLKKLALDLYNRTGTHYIVFKNKNCECYDLMKLSNFDKSDNKYIIVYNTETKKK